MKFVHLTDTHICRDYSTNVMKDLFERCASPAENLRVCMEEMKDTKPDFVLITGDLVHEGTKEDYEYMISLTQDIMGPIPVFYTLGNHDRKEAFYAAMEMEVDGRPCNYTAQIQGLRVIVLDSAVAGHEHGSISVDQEEWLRTVLETESPLGSILAFHHPIAAMEGMGMSVSENFKEIIQNSDIRGIFCGHTHFNSVDAFAGIPQYTADSMAFGLGFEGTDICFIEKTGYNVCTIDEEKITVHTEVTQPKPAVFAKFSMEMLMASMN